MKRTKYLLTVVSILVISFSYAQKISKIDFDDVKAKTLDSFSVYYYPLLLEKFQKLDTTMTWAENKYLYYGNVYYKNYDPYGLSEKEEKFMKVYKQQKYKEAIALGLEAMKENPINLKLIYKLLICYHQSGDKELARRYAWMYFSLLNVIYTSGDGKGVETAMVVTRVSDEYEILADLELTLTKQSLLKGNTDMMTVNTKNQKVKKGQKKVKALYFNVSMPMSHLIQQFKPTE